MKNFSLSLYAFHLCNYLSNASDEVVSNADRLWENLAKLSESLLSLPGLKDLKSNLISYQNGIYTPKREQRKVNEWLTNSGKSLPLGIIPTEEGFQMEGNLQPFRLNDTYAVDLTLSPESPDTSIDVAQLKYFNPQGCLLPASIDASLGQTLLLCGKVNKNDEDCRILAKECAIALLAGSKFCHLCFNNIPIKFWLFVLKINPVIGILFVAELNLAAAHQGKLFGSLLFEYEVTDLDSPQNPTKQCHILLWLNNSNADTAKLAGEAYDWLLNLLCCRHKLRYAYHHSRSHYKKARDCYSKLEQEGQNLARLPEDLEKRLANLKYSLTQVSTKLFDYEFHLRELQAYLTAIKTNATNYKQCLNQLPTLPEDDLGFWQDFLKKDCNHFQAQIQTDLKYLNPGRDLFQQLITTIRGIVEIEQAESDRALEKTLREKEEAAERREKKLEESRRKEEEAAEEREKRLQLWIALVGTGLAVSGISAQTDAKPVETFLIGRLEPNQTLDCPNAGRDICLEYYGFYIVIHILVGAIAASVLGLIIWLLSDNRLGGKVKQIWHTLTSKKTKNVFTKNMVADLDKPVRRYFLHAIAPGTPLATSVELEISGSFRLKPDIDWKPTATSEIISISSDIIEKAKLGKGLRKFSFLSLISLFNAQNDNDRYSGIGELGIEYICLPSALLPYNGVTWQAIADDTIQANFKIDNEPIAMTLTINSEGKLLKMSVQHCGNPTEKGDWHNISFGGEIQAEKTFGGYTIPAKMIAGWWFGTDKYWEFFQLSIEQAKFS